MRNEMKIVCRDSGLSPLPPSLSGRLGEVLCESYGNRPQKGWALISCHSPQASLLRTARGQRPNRRFSLMCLPRPSLGASASGGPRRIPKAQALEVPTGSRPVRDASPGHHTRPFRRWLGRRQDRSRVSYCRPSPGPVPWSTSQSPSQPLHRSGLPVRSLRLVRPADPALPPVLLSIPAFAAGFPVPSFRSRRSAFAFL